MFAPRLRLRLRLARVPRFTTPTSSTRARYLSTQTQSQPPSNQPGRPVPSKDDIDASSKETTRSGTNDEVAHTNQAAYGKATNPFEERKLADSEEKTERPGSLDYSPANPQVSHQGEEDKSPTTGTKDARKTSGGSKNAT